MFVDADRGTFAGLAIGLPGGGLLNSETSFAEAVLSRTGTLVEKGLFGSFSSVCITTPPECCPGFAGRTPAAQRVMDVLVDSVGRACPAGDC